MARMTWEEAQRLKRGDIFNMRIVYYVTRSKETGPGRMSDSPGRVIWVCSDGSVWEMVDPSWMMADTLNPRMLHRGSPV